MQQVCGKMSEVLKQKIRRDLSRWSRKLLLCIGLEDIGKELVGEKEWKRLYPLRPDWEQDRTSDFDSTEVPEQYFDISDLPRIDPSETLEEETNEDKNDFLENFFHLLPYWYFINRAFGVPGAGTINTSEDLSNRNPVSDTLDAQRLNCLLFLQSLKQQQLQVQTGVTDGFNNIQNLSFPSVDCFDDAESSATTTTFPFDKDYIRLPFSLPGLTLAYSTQDDLDQPLDLTQKTTQVSHATEPPQHFKLNSKERNDTSLGDNKISVLRTNKTASIRGQRSGRGYTAQELEAALKDIQSGKLGTRRAAVIYGIPRSTLRNKVYKLGKDRSRSYFRPKTGNKRVCGVQNLSSPNSALSEEIMGNSISSKIESNCDVKSKLSLLPVCLSSGPSSHSQGAFTRELDEEVEIDEEEDSKLELDDISHEKKVLKEWLRSKLTRQGLIQKNSGKECLTGGTRILSSSRKRLSDSSDNSDGSKEDSRPDVILKIPSLLNNKSSLSRLISKQKLKRMQENDEKSESTYKPSLPRRSYSSASTSTRTGGDGRVQKIVKHQQFGDNSMDESEVDSTVGTDSKGIFYDADGPVSSYLPRSNSTRNCAPPSSDSNGKKSRPKRGKYRNYDRDALLKAVRAVQNGEMSVHRAGSFYGVPHSTLEYKVKERHLLRRTKKDPGSPKCTQKSSPESSLSGSDIPMSSHNLSSTVSSSSTQFLDSRHLPLPSDFRETLSRYLNIDQPFRLQSHSAPISPDSSVKRHQIAKIDSTEANYQRRGTKKDDDEHMNVEVGYNSSILNMFQFDNHPRQNFDSLLDLSKKSE